MSIKNIRHVGIVVTNLEKTLKFYVDLLGLKIGISGHLEGKWINTLLGINKLSTIKLHVNNKDCIELYFIENTPISKGFNHVAFTVDNLDEIYKTLKKVKIHFFSEPIVDPFETHKIVFCQDFDGNLIELVEDLK